MRVINATRDQLPDFSSYYGNRYVSLDCNDHSGRTARGIEIVVPSDITHSEVTWCEINVEMTQVFFMRHGWDAPIRRRYETLPNGRATNGIKHSGGHSGVIHTEHFFIYNETPRRIIAENAAEYAQILIDTLGQIENMSFILPHTKRDPGAVSADGYSEREFAKYNVMPSLLHRSTQGSMSLAQDTPPREYIADSRPVVTFEEEIETQGMLA